MKQNRSLNIGGAIVFITAAYSAWRYATLPDRIPMHFNAQGDVDRYGSKLEGVLFCPVLMIILLAVFVILPKMLPEGKRIDPFRKAYDTVVVVTMGFMACVQFMILNPGLLGTGMGQVKFMMVAMSAMFIVLGNLMGKTERNYIMGIRTPWTLESDEVWHRTHRLGGQLMVGAGLLSLIFALLGVNVLVITGVILMACFYPVWYSYALYQRLYPGKKP